MVYRRGGFTLTELLVGIAALGVLTSIAGAEMFEQRRRAYDAVAQSCARDIRHHQALALADQQRFKNFDLFALKTIPSCNDVITSAPQTQERGLEAAPYGEKGITGAASPHSYIYFTRHARGSRAFVATETYLGDLNTATPEVLGAAGEVLAATGGVPPVIWPTNSIPAGRGRLNMVINLKGVSGQGVTYLGINRNAGLSKLCNTMSCNLSFDLPPGIYDFNAYGTVYPRGTVLNRTWWLTPNYNIFASGPERYYEIPGLMTQGSLKINSSVVRDFPMGQADTTAALPTHQVVVTSGATTLVEVEGAPNPRGVGGVAVRGFLPYPGLDQLQIMVPQEDVEWDASHLRGWGWPRQSRLNPTEANRSQGFQAVLSFSRVPGNTYTHPNDLVAAASAVKAGQFVASCDQLMVDMLSPSANGWMNCVRQPYAQNLALGEVKELDLGDLVVLPNTNIYFELDPEVNIEKFKNANLGLEFTIPNTDPVPGTARARLYADSLGRRIAGNMVSWNFSMFPGTSYTPYISSNLDSYGCRVLFSAKDPAARQVTAGSSVTYLVRPQSAGSCS